MTHELAAAYEELRRLRLALAAEVEARRELERRLEATTRPVCEVCGLPATSPLDYAYWPSMDGDVAKHVAHPDCAEALVPEPRSPQK